MALKNGVRQRSSWPSELLLLLNQLSGLSRHVKTRTSMLATEESLELVVVRREYLLYLHMLVQLQLGLDVAMSTAVAMNGGRHIPGLDR